MGPRRSPRPKEDKKMTKLEREKYLLALNEAQRLAFLLTISNLFLHTNTFSSNEFEEILRSYHPMEKKEDGELASLNLTSTRKRGPGHRHQTGR